MMGADATENFQGVAAGLVALDILLVITHTRRAHGTEFAEVQELTRRAFVTSVQPLAIPQMPGAILVARPSAPAT